MQIDGVPDQITRRQVCDLLTVLGLDPHHVTRDGVHIGPDAIECEVFALDAQGRRFLSGEEVATHRVTVKVVPDE